MSKLLNVSSSPHVRSHETTHSIMLDVAIAMLPATAFGVYHFGMHALLVLIVTVAACVLSEYVYETLMKKQSTLSDCRDRIMPVTRALQSLMVLCFFISFSYTYSLKTQAATVTISTSSACMPK